MAALPEQLPGRIGAYEILGSLGQGGMARTYVAMRHGPGGFEQRVCLKRIRSEHDKDPEFVRQFLAEAKIAASVSHANLVKVLDFGTDPEGYFLALELVQGMDLWGVFSTLAARGERLDPNLVAYVAIELATALEVLHRASPDGHHKGLVHRDVSPSNVLISYDGEVKLADFGIARAVDGPKHTRTGIIKGKVPYMAPSYARTAKADVRCDLYAVGVVLFELLAGRRPYQGTTDLMTLELAAQGKHAPLASLAPNAPPALVAAAERLIEPNPELSFQSASELLIELSALPLAGATLRRQLGQLVERLRPQRASVFGAQPSQPPAALAGDTTTFPAPASMAIAGPADPTRPAARQQTDPEPAAQSTRRHVWMIAGVAALFLAIAGWATLMVIAPRTDPANTPVRAGALPSTSTPSDGNKQPRSPVLRGVLEEATTGTANAASDPERAERKATLTVVVMPFGEVILDGKSRGQSPVTAKVSAGEHEVTVVRQGVHTSQRVDLTPGETRRVIVK